MKAKDVIRKVLELCEAESNLTELMPYAKVNPEGEGYWVYSIPSLMEKISSKDSDVSECIVEQGILSEDEIIHLPFRLKNTVDTIKEGDPETEVTGAAVTFIASIDVIKQAIENDINLIITHEPTYYTGRDDREWLAGDEMYEYKKKLINDYNLCIWRFHDLIHSFSPDRIVTGTIKKLNWENRLRELLPIGALVDVKGMKLKEVAMYIKEKLGTPNLRIIGDMDMPVSRCAVMVGSAGGQNQLSAAREANADLLICGEIAEWETSEYVRDAVQAGKKIALIVAGHCESECAGMEDLAGFMKDKIDLPVQYLESGHLFNNIAI